MKSFLFGLALLLLLAPSSVFADSGCGGAYGSSCPTGNLSINKTVQHPQSGEFLDAISSTDTTFLPEQEVKFRIEVKNTGSEELRDVWVDDILPDYVQFVSGTGNFDNGQNKLWWKIEKLGSGETKTFEIRAKLKPAGQLPNMAITCMTNHTKAVKDSMSAEDTASFCVQTKILGTTTELPKTGPGSFEMLTGLSIISSLLAISFARKSTKA